MNRKYRLRLVALLLAVAALALFGLFGLAASTREPDAKLVDPRLAQAYRFDRNRWVYVHLEGPPGTIGFAHGYLLAREMLWPKMDAEYQEEIQGIVEGLAARQVRVDRDDLVALNAFEELPDYYV